MSEIGRAVGSLARYHSSDIQRMTLSGHAIYESESPPPNELVSAPADDASAECANIENGGANGAQESVEESPCINVMINNVVASFSVRCHINLRKLAMEAANVEYKVANGMVSMKLRKPYTTASIWSSGKITCTGSTSEIDAKIAARRISRILQRLGFRVKLSNFRVVNVLGTCSMPFGINIRNFSEEYRSESSYEPELHPGVTFRIKEPKATLKIFSTGSLTITAPSVDNVQCAVAYVFPLVYPFKTPKPVKKVSEAKQLLDRHYGTKRLKRMGQTDDSDQDDDDVMDDDLAEVSDEFDYGSYSEDEVYASDQSFD